MRTISILDLSFVVDDRHNPLFWTAVAEKRWEVETFAALKKHLSPGAVFVDIGCWEGVFSLYAAKMGAKIYAIDADEVALQHFQGHLKVNPTLAPQISVFQTAIAPTNGKLNFYARNAFGDSAASLLNRVLDVNQTTEVEGQTFVYFCQKQAIPKVDFIKMDIEGGEFMILREMVNTLEQYHYPTLYIAFHPQYLLEADLKHYTRSALIGRIILKCCKILRISLLKQKIQDQYRQIFESLLQGYEMKNDSGETMDWQNWINSGACLAPANILFERKTARVFF